jgi:hypothetical protein
MERREERERAALPKDAAATSSEEGRPEVRVAMLEWLSQAGRSASPLSSRERERRGERRHRAELRGERIAEPKKK